jgi:hypothetical protein
MEVAPNRPGRNHVTLRIASVVSIPTLEGLAADSLPDGSLTTS